MSETGIEWTDKTWNPLVGCSIVSPGCAECYAMREAARIERMSKGAGRATHYAGLTKYVNGKPVWTGDVKLAPETKLLEPLHWKKPARVFVNSMSDLFHENVSAEWIDFVVAVIALCARHKTDDRQVIIGYEARHDFQILTKRPHRMRQYISRIVGLANGDLSTFLDDQFSQSIRKVSKAAGHPFWMNAPLSVLGWIEEGLPGLWLGVTAERQEEYDARKEDLRATPAARRFFSFEPLLGPIKGDYFGDWAICGGLDAGFADPDHVRALRDQCAAAGVPFFFKRWGAFLAGRNIRNESGLFFEFGDGSEFHIFSDGDDILVDRALTHRGAPEKIWRSYWASGDGRLLRRCSKDNRKLDGVEHNSFPRPRS